MAIISDISGTIKTSFKIGDRNIISGSGIPEQLLGNNNDLFINDTGDIYQKSANVWHKINDSLVNPMDEPGDIIVYDSSKEVNKLSAGEEGQALISTTETITEGGVEKTVKKLEWKTLPTILPEIISEASEFTTNTQVLSNDGVSPSWEDIVIKLLSVSDVAPVSAVDGDMYYDINDNLIYTFNGNAWVNGKSPINNRIYMSLTTKRLYAAENDILTQVGGNGDTLYTPIYQTGLTNGTSFLSIGSTLTSKDQIILVKIGTDNILQTSTLHRDQFELSEDGTKVILHIQNLATLSEQAPVANLYYEIIYVKEVSMGMLPNATPKVIEGTIASDETTDESTNILHLTDAIPDKKFILYVAVDNKVIKKDRYTLSKDGLTITLLNDVCTKWWNVAYVDNLNIGNIPHAEETVFGIIRLATQSEVNDGLDDETAVTPLKLKNYLGGGGSGSYMTNPMQTYGDLIIGGQGGTPNRLAVPDNNLNLVLRTAVREGGSGNTLKYSKITDDLFDNGTISPKILKGNPDLIGNKNKLMKVKNDESGLEYTNNITEETYPSTPKNGDNFVFSNNNINLTDSFPANEGTIGGLVFKDQTNKKIGQIYCGASNQDNIRTIEILHVVESQNGETLLGYFNLLCDIGQNPPKSWATVSTPDASASNDEVITASWARSVISCPVGTIIAYIGTNTPSGYFFCDGSIISSVDYPQLCSVLGSNQLPNLADGRYLQGVSNNVGGYEDDGLPNIIGTGTRFNHELWTPNNQSDHNDGAIFKGSAYGECALTGTNNNNAESTYGWSFNASGSNPIYGNSDHIQPKNLRVRFLIKHD